MSLYRFEFESTTNIEAEKKPQRVDRGTKKLAVAVIEMAVKDFKNCNRLAEHTKDKRALVQRYNSAVRFLLPENDCERADLEFWCERAEIDIHHIINWGRKEMLTHTGMKDINSV